MLMATVVLCVILLISWYFYLHYIQYTSCDCKVRLDGKVVVLTGATSGIGKETAIDLAQRGARLILPCLQLDEGNKVRDELIQQTGNTDIIIRKLDLSSLKSVREFSQQIITEELQIDILIHNAGVGYCCGPNILSEDGFEVTMAVNYFGPFLLTLLLIDLLKKSEESRIVIVTSWLYLLGYINLKQLNPVKTFPIRNYCISKYAIVIFTRELARRLKGTRVTVNCVHPGTVDTEIWDNKLYPPISWLLNLLRKSFFKNPKMGAQTTIHVAVADEVTDVSGKFFSDCQVWGLIGKADADAKGKKLWELSEESVKLQPSDPQI